MRKNFLQVAYTISFFLFVHYFSYGQRIGNNSLPNSSSSYTFDCPLKIFPQSDDFTDEENGKHIGKVIISTRDEDDSYYTSYQTEDRIVNIYVDAPKGLAGETVYFELIDPDDQSSYETDSEGDDNGGAGILSQSSAILDLDGDFNITLTITERFSGDNYIVRASLDPDFPENQTVETVEMVAWKRPYLEHHKMFVNGSFLVEGAGISTSNAIQIEVFDLGNMEEGDHVIIFTPTDDNNPNGYTLFSTIEKIEETSNDTYFFTILNPNLQLPRFSGIRKVGDNTTYSLMPSSSSENFDWNILNDAYGCDSYGTDGGVFVEFKEIIPNIVNIPKFTHREGFSGLVSLYKSFIMTWSEYAVEGSNILATIAAGNWVNSLSEPGGLLALGFSVREENHCSLFIENFEEDSEFISPQSYSNEVLAHELAHQFDVWSSHVDQPFFEANHDASESCIMVHNQHQLGPLGAFNDLNNSNAEFDFLSDGCIKDIREEADKL